MLYPTINQPIVFIAIFFTGLACGVVFDVFRILTMLSGGDKWSRHIFDFLAGIFSFFLLFFVNLKVNYGQCRIFVFAVFLLSFYLERLISKFLWTKLLSRWYTNITKINGEIAKKLKHGRKKKEND